MLHWHANDIDYIELGKELMDQAINDIGFMF